MKRYGALLAGLTLAVLLGACGGNDKPAASPQPTAVPTRAASGLPQDGEPVHLNPANFVAEIDNPFWPMKPGARWVYAEMDADGNELQVESQ